MWKQTTPPQEPLEPGIKHQTSKPASSVLKFQLAESVYAAAHVRSLKGDLVIFWPFFRLLPMRKAVSTAGLL